MSAQTTTHQVAKKVVMSGIQPTGFIHLGNYLGAVKNWIHLQNNADYTKYFCVVDYHSITQKFIGKDVPEFDPEDQIGLQEELIFKDGRPEELTLKTTATLLACGIDPKQSTLFVQSHVASHAEMMWLLSSLTPLSWLNKMIQFKEKKSSSDKHSSLSLYSYPVLMAADILLYQANYVPVGEDQTQHLELARDLADRFNRLFGQQFPLPDKLDLESACPRVMSLVDGRKKMSKSDRAKRSCLNLIDDPEIIRVKIQKAKTDSFGTIKYDPVNRPEVSNLLRIYASLKNMDVTKVDQVFENDNMFRFKEKVANSIIDQICPIGEKTLLLCEKHEDMMLDILDQGAKEADRQAKITLNEMKEKVGILRSPQSL